MSKHQRSTQLLIPPLYASALRLAYEENVLLILHIPNIESGEEYI